MRDEGKEVFQLRKSCGLPPVVAKPRVCLACGERFDSVGSHNRICEDCRADRKSDRNTANAAARMLAGLGKQELRVYPGEV